MARSLPTSGMRMVIYVHQRPLGSALPVSTPFREPAREDSVPPVSNWIDMRRLLVELVSRRRQLTASLPSPKLIPTVLRGAY